MFASLTLWVGSVRRRQAEAHRAAKLRRPEQAGHSYITIILGISALTAYTNGTNIISTCTTHTNSRKLTIISDEYNVRYPILLLLHCSVSRQVDHRLRWALWPHQYVPIQYFTSPTFFPLDSVLL